MSRRGALFDVGRAAPFGPGGRRRVAPRQKERKRLRRGSRVAVLRAVLYGLPLIVMLCIRLHFMTRSS
jgi:hypothetical protein